MIRHDFSHRRWRKSSYSPDESADCVEIRLADDLISIRDSKMPPRGTLAVPSRTWAAFVRAVEHDRIGPT
ncbi:DUF397 domain-containing protein [Streptomyces sp. NPDC051162]|uniref:DUF397 domain-containing protein n=1 Tax=unclassified Streptomyces TaxID=2593676 RepID=UPI00341D2B64